MVDLFVLQQLNRIFNLIFSVHSVLDPLCVLIAFCLMHFIQLELLNEEKPLKASSVFLETHQLEQRGLCFSNAFKENATKR